jgi:hypothetical protein
MNLTFAAPTEIGTLTQYATYVNFVTGDLFWLLGIFTAWIFFFIGLIKTFDELSAMGWSSFITTLLSLMLVSMGLINNYSLSVCNVNWS